MNIKCHSLSINIAQKVDIQTVPHLETTHGQLVPGCSFALMLQFVLGPILFNPVWAGGADLPTLTRIPKFLIFALQTHAEIG